MTESAVLPDPTDLDGLRRRLAVGGHGRDGGGTFAQPSGIAAAVERHPIGIGRVRIGSNALLELADDVAAVRGPGPVVVLVDETPIRRAGADLKRDVVAALSARFETRLAVIRANGAELHADVDALAQADAAVRGAGCVVSVGSGTITDVAKDASLRAGKLPFVVVQTAVSVNAFSDDMAVLLRDGVKRTVPSRWPDVLIVDLEVLADAPPAMNQAGFGELCSMFTAPADWYLANAVGLSDGYDPGIVSLFRDGAATLLEGAGRVAANEPAMLAELATRMTLTGIAMGVAGRTAPLSGTEHLFSHLLDMAAARAGRPLAFHGAQVGVASVLASTIWHDTLDRLDPGRLCDDDAFPEPVAVERGVRVAFDSIDPSGRMAVECWRDVRTKLDRWRASRSTIAAFVAGWDDHRAVVRDLVATPATLSAALRAAGAPATVDELDPAISPDMAHWALRALPLMRERFTVVDLRFFAGAWTDDRADELLDRSGILGGHR
jgi:glycerol-1-phosphate dehydrogenase [NAD(P)+]